MDRNALSLLIYRQKYGVALRKESVDRNCDSDPVTDKAWTSLSARRAWIERLMGALTTFPAWSLSARRAWIEMHPGRYAQLLSPQSLSARRAWIEIRIGGAQQMAVYKSLSARRAWIEISRLRRQ